MVIIALFPGQGSQTPGFLRPWLERDGVRARLDQFSQWAEVDLIEAGTEADNAVGPRRTSVGGQKQRAATGGDTRAQCFRSWRHAWSA